MAEGMVLSNDNAYRDAVKKWEEAIASYDRLPERDRTLMRDLAPG